MSTLWRLAPACALFLVPIAYAQKTPIVDDYTQDFRQKLPETPKAKPHAFNRHLFVAAEFALAGAKTFDAIETRRALDHGGMEFNPVFGNHPSPERQAALNACTSSANRLCFTPRSTVGIAGYAGLAAFRWG